jgi:histone deacetylase 11
VAFGYSFRKHSTFTAEEKAPAYLGLASIAFFCLYPILTETFINLGATIFYSKQREIEANNRKVIKFTRMKYPFIYSESYNLTACGLEKVHPFDSIKYRRVFQALVEDHQLI